MLLQANPILERVQEELISSEITQLFKEKDFIELNECWMIINHKNTVYRIMRSYGDDLKRQVLMCIAETAMTIPQIVDKTNLPTSSIYREVDELISDGLLLRVGHDKTTRKSATLFLALIQNMKVEIDGNKISVLIKTNHSNDVFSL
jgi:transposase-like protein